MFGPNHIGNSAIPTLLGQGGISTSAAVLNRFALELDGVDQTIRFVAATAPSTAWSEANSDNQFTLNMWVRFPDKTAVGDIYGIGSSAVYNRLFLSSSGTQINFWSVENANIACAFGAAASLSNDTWHMITVVGTRSTNWSITIYLDGTALTTAGVGGSHDFLDSGSTFLAKALGAASYSEMDFDEMSFFKTALSAANVSYLYNNLFDLTTWSESTGKLLWWYRLENNAEDSTGTYGTGTLINSPSFLSADSTTLPYNS